MPKPRAELVLVESWGSLMVEPVHFKQHVVDNLRFANGLMSRMAGQFGEVTRSGLQKIELDFQKGLLITSVFVHPYKNQKMEAEYKEAATRHAREQADKLGCGVHVTFKPWSKAEGNKVFEMVFEAEVPPQHIPPLRKILAEDEAVKGKFRAFGTRLLDPVSPGPVKAAEGWWILLKRSLGIKLVKPQVFVEQFRKIAGFASSREGKLHSLILDRETGHFIAEVHVPAGAQLSAEYPAKARELADDAKRALGITVHLIQRERQQGDSGRLVHKFAYNLIVPKEVASTRNIEDMLRKNGFENLQSKGDFPWSEKTFWEKFKQKFFPK